MTTTNEMIIYLTLYYLIVATLTGISLLTVGRWWRHSEAARYSVGVITIMLPAVLFIALGVLSLTTWLWIAGAFVVSGVIKVAYDTTQAGHSEIVRATRREIVANVETLRAEAAANSNGGTEILRRHSRPDSRDG